MRKGKEIDLLVLMQAKLGGSAKVAQILEEDIKDGLAYLVTSASGSPASFPDGADDIPVVDLKVSIEPVQSGSGDPSPSNVRPISGWTGMTLSHSGEDMSDPDTLSISWQSEAGTVYGGTLDVTTGVLTVDKAKTTLAQAANVYGWVKDTAGYVFFKCNTALNILEPYVLCDHYKTLDAIVQSSDVQGIAIYDSSKNYNLRVRDSNYSSGTAEEFLQAMGNAEIVYKLATPVTYQLTPQEVKTLLGVNNIWADCGGVDVEYRADLDKYIEKREHPTDAGTLGLILGAAPSVIRPGVGLEMQDYPMDVPGSDWSGRLYPEDAPWDEIPEGFPEEEEEDEPEDDSEFWPKGRLAGESELTEEPEEGSEDDAAE